MVTPKRAESRSCHTGVSLRVSRSRPRSDRKSSQCALHDRGVRTGGFVVISRGLEVACLFVNGNTSLLLPAISFHFLFAH